MHADKLSKNRITNEVFFIHSKCVTQRNSKINQQNQLSGVKNLGLDPIT